VRSFLVLTTAVLYGSGYLAVYFVRMNQNFSVSFVSFTIVLTVDTLGSHCKFSVNMLLSFFGGQRLPISTYKVLRSLYVIEVHITHSGFIFAIMNCLYFICFGIYIYASGFGASWSWSKKTEAHCCWIWSVVSLSQDVPDYKSDLVSLNLLESKPLNNLRIGIIQETLGEGVDTGVISSIKAAASHLEQLGSVVEEVCCFHLAVKKW
jgi:hypothetical protein